MTLDVDWPAVVTRRQALAAGLGSGAITHRIGTKGRWQRILPGVYLTHTGPATEIERLEAALAYAGPEAIVNGLTACRLHELRSAPRGLVVHVLLPHRVHRPSVGFVAVRRTKDMPRFAHVNGVPTASVARAVIDGSRELPDLGAVRALVAESVQRRKTTIVQLRYELDHGAMAGSALVRAALREVRAGVRSAAEAAAREFVRRTGLPEPLWNCELYGPNDEWIARPDGYWEEAGAVLEVDSPEWHFTAAGWKWTMERHAHMTSYGLLVMHVAPSRIRDEPEAVAAELRSMLEVGRGRGGAPNVRSRRSATS